MNKLSIILSFLLSTTPILAQESVATLGTSGSPHTLQELIDFAMTHNIQLQQRRLTSMQSHEDVLQSQSALFPSVSFSTNHNMSYRPFAEQTVNLSNGSMTTSRNSVSYNGSYGINANWTVWNGGRNYNQIKQNKISEQQSVLAEQQTANSIQEQIAQLYVQILYETEAVKVNKEIVKCSELQRDRASVMVDAGSLARVDLVQLEAQVAQDKYSLVQSESQLANYTLQLKQLLEIHDDEDFIIANPMTDDSFILTQIPDKQAVYIAALEHRPEIKNDALNVELSEISLRSARAGYMPTLSVNAGIGTSMASGVGIGAGTQLKNSLSNSLGVTLSVPIFDNHQARTQIRKAKSNIQSSQLSLIDSQKQLYSTIEQYWLNATTSQQQYLYAKANKESMQMSYDLVSEQFSLGLKNIVELTTGKNNLLLAQQQLLQTKYTALLNQALLKFYSGEPLKL